MRVIDADELIIQFRRAIETFLPNDPRKHMNPVDSFKCQGWQQGLMVIQDAPTIQPEPHWIPVTERLPEDDVYVLLTVRRMDDSYNHVPFISTGYISWNHQCWWCAHDGNCKDANIDVLA